ncbi:MAG: glycosyltransferase family 4 protein [Anaerolineae bacterium]
MKAADGKPIVGLNAHLLSMDAGYRNAGLSRYIYHLMHHLPLVAPDLGFVGYVGDSTVSVPGWQMRPSAWRTASAPRRIAWEQLAQPWALRRDHVDLAHAPVYVGPLIHRCPIVVTIHDLTFFRFPELFPAGNRRYLQRMTRATATRASRVIVDSASTQDDVMELLDIPSERIAVIYPGVSLSSTDRPNPEKTRSFRARLMLENDYVLFVGTLEPRKNIALLLDAWAMLASHHGLHPTLVIVGGKGWFYEQLDARVRALGLTDSVRFAGYVPDEELASWYAAATLFVFPSLYEGFGFTPLEAMACGVPVVTSNRSSLPEVVGNAGIALPPDDPTAWADTIAMLLSSPEKRSEMVEAGYRQAASFSWDDTARKTADVYRQVLQNG